MIFQAVLDLAGGDVLAAADDQILLAAGDEEVAILVDPSEVAGVQPAVDDGGAGRLFLLVVALHDPSRADADLALLTGNEELVAVVHDPELDIGHRLPNRAEPRLFDL